MPGWFCNFILYRNQPEYYTEGDRMSQEYIEITEKNLQDAITTACQKLSVTSDRLDYEIIDPGKSGFLGIGARPAKIRARRKEAAEATQAILDQVMSNVEQRVQTKSANSAESKDGPKDNKAARKITAENKSEQKTSAEKSSLEKQSKTVKKSVSDSEKTQKKTEKKAEKTEKKNQKQAVKGTPVPEYKQQKSEHPTADSRSDNKKYRSNRGGRDSRNGRNGNGRNMRGRQESTYKPEIASAETVAAAEAAAENAAKKKPAKPLVLTDEQIDSVKKKAESFLKDVFSAMNMEVQITEKYDPESGVLNISLEGDDMAVLIGKRGQTLDSLQYLITLVVNRDKDFDGYIHVKADTENYRERRRKTLENLAKNMAAKVKRTGKAFTFEPMNPYERRIIHSALQNDKYVTTYSEGEEPYRKVVVILKKDPGEDFARRDRRGGHGDRRGRNGRGDRRNNRSGYDRSDRKRYDRVPETTSEKAEALQSDSEALHAAEAASRRAEEMIEKAEKVQTEKKADELSGQVDTAAPSVSTSQNAADTE